MEDNKWIHSRDEEYFSGEEFDTKEECIEDGKEYYDGNSFYIGLTKDFNKKIDIAETAIEMLRERVYDSCGLECLENVNLENVKKLDNMFWEIFEKWLKEEKEFLCHYKVIDIEKVEF